MKRSSVLSMAVLSLWMGVLAGCGGMYGHTVLVNRKAGVDGPAKATLGQPFNHPATGQPTLYKILKHTDDLRRYAVVKGGPEDKGDGEVADLWARDVKASGSILGFRVNQAMTVKVASSAFTPRVMVLERLTQRPTSDKDEFYVAADSNTLVSSAGGMNINVVDYRWQKDNLRDGTNITGIVIAVFSADGKAGEYSIQVESKN